MNNFVTRSLLGALFTFSFAPQAFGEVSSSLAPKAVEAYVKTLQGTETAGLSPTLFENSDIIAAIESLSAHGLDPNHYHLDRLKKDGVVGDAMTRLALDAWMSAASHLSQGKLKPTSVEPDWTAKGREIDLASAFVAAKLSGSYTDGLNAIAPQHASYKALQLELGQLMDVASSEQSAVPEGKAIHPKESSQRVRAMQTRLFDLGYLLETQITGTHDEESVNALKSFQDKMNLDTDGVAGSGTIRALNRGPQSKIQTVRANLERWRWLPDNLGDRHVRVNIAGFTASTYENGNLQKTHLTITGKPYRATPVFSGEISYIVFNPWWETPASLARRDKLPLFKRDPGAVDRLGYQVLDTSGNLLDASAIDWNSVPAGTMPYRLRQKPGAVNALGQVKIMFPNKHNVYLHDTPDRGLFSKRQRAFSSGCIRTQDPIDLSEWLLAAQGDWPRSKIDEALASGKETRANLTQKVPVHILYMTAVMDAGGIRYLDDIYSRDDRVIGGLNTKPVGLAKP